jgi:carbonic anhydrase
MRKMMELKNKSKIKFVAIAGVALLAITATASGAATSWTYTGKTGPSHWKEIDPTNYAVCADGTAQSPINIVNPVKSDLVNLKFSYKKSEAGIFNNGHTVEAEPLGTEKSTVTIGNTVYNFAQFHFHAPSEHEITGLHYPVEIHFVNKSDSGKLAVVGVFVKAGAENENWKEFTDKITTATADPEATKVELDWAKLLPTNKTTVRYDGSLTTPGCSEGVKWNVMVTPITLSQAQINQFLEAYSGNNRPVQPLNNRVVKLDTTPLK